MATTLERNNERLTELVEGLTEVCKPREGDGMGEIIATVDALALTLASTLSCLNGQASRKLLLKASKSAVLTAMMVLEAGE